MPTNPSYKPVGYTSVAPYLIVSNGAAALEFVRDVFGATELQHYAAPEGRILHAEVRIDDTVVMLADGTQDWPPAPCHVHVYVPDVDATFASALRHGATAVQAPMKRDDPDKRGGFKDPWGTTWWIGTRVG